MFDGPKILHDLANSIGKRQTLKPKPPKPGTTACRHFFNFSFFHFFHFSFFHVFLYFSFLPFSFHFSRTCD